MIQLEKFDKSNYEKLISWIDTAEALMQFAGPSFSFPLTKEQLDKSLNDKNKFAFQAIELSTQAMIGYVEIHLKENSAYLGRIIIEEKLRGKGYGKEIVSYLLYYAFKNLNQSKVELNVFEWNIVAINCYKKMGFVFKPENNSERKVNDKTWVALNMVLEIEDSYNLSSGSII
jgi:RimJ/RimL family protein N-acetyltransferase